MTAATENTGMNQQAPTKWLMPGVLAVAVPSLPMLGAPLYSQCLPPHTHSHQLTVPTSFLTSPATGLEFHQGWGVWVSGIWVYSLGSVLKVLIKVWWVNDEMNGMNCPRQPWQW